MNGLVAYGSDSEDEDVPTTSSNVKTPSPRVKPVRVTPSVKLVPSTTTWNSSGANSLGGSILASEYQLRMLSRQRAKAASSGSKKRIFITAPNLDDLEDDEPDVKPPKKKIVAAKTRSKLFSALPKPKKELTNARLTVQVPIISSSLSTNIYAPSTSASSKPTTSSFMPNSVKNPSKLKPVTSVKRPVLPNAQLASTKEEESDSDDEGGFFSFSSKEKDEEELKKHAASLPVGPIRPSSEMLITERAKYSDAGPLPVHGSTRHPDEVDSAIAPYGNDMSSFKTIAGRIAMPEDLDNGDVAMNVDRQAIMKLQGRRREDVQFVDASVDKSLGNIRENIRKSANQQHVSTSMVDPVREMRKNDPNAHVSKRTHQLKYLVELAKANESRLNQLWSNAKSSSRTTAMKYGW